MGVWPNEDGQKCIADLIWEADTIDPGVTPLKWKLGTRSPEDRHLRIMVAPKAPPLPLSPPAAGRGWPKAG